MLSIYNAKLCSSKKIIVVIISTVLFIQLHYRYRQNPAMPLFSLYKRVINWHDKQSYSILFYTSEANISVTLPNCVLYQKSIWKFNGVIIKRNSSTSEQRKQLQYQARKNHLSQSIVGYDVVIFHVKDMPGSRLLKDVSTSRPNGQIWAYYNKESPYNTINIVDGKYDNIFNMTITPQRNSDVFAPYGYYESKQDQTMHWMKKFKGNVIFEKSTSHNTSLNHENMILEMVLGFEHKDLFVAWIASHCNEPRDRLVRALQQYIPVHVYGQCGVKFHQSRICERNTVACEFTLRRYKFILAFENSFCDDYITEKYWNALFRGNIPIVYGGSRYDAAVAIPGSYINARSFKSVKLLADYMKHLSQSKAEYEKYFVWRTEYQMNYKPNDRQRFEIMTNNICKFMRKNVRLIKTYILSEFYGQERNCPLQLSTGVN